MLHITNGDCAVEALQAPGFDQPIIPWREVLHEGPVPVGLNLVELSRVRAGFIASCAWGEREEIQAAFRERDAALKASVAEDEAVLSGSSRTSTTSCSSVRFWPTTATNRHCRRDCFWSASTEIRKTASLAAWDNGRRRHRPLVGWHSLVSLWYCYALEWCKTVCSECPSPGDLERPWRQRNRHVIMW